MLRWAALALFIFLCDGQQKEYSSLRNNSQFERGWGSTIRWAANYSDAMMKMLKSQKPLMVIHHLDRCPYSQALKKMFAENKTIQKMARESFIMLNVVEDTGDPNLSIDGHYVPRILFIDPARVVRNDIKGRYDNKQFTYGPDDQALLIENMKKAKVSKHKEL